MAVVKENRAKVLKITLWIGGVLAFLLLAAVIAGFVLEKKLPDKMKALVHEESHGVYELRFSSLNVSLWRGALTLQGIELSADTSVYDTLSDSLKTKDLYGLEADRLSIGGASIWNYLLHGKIKLGSLRLESPRLLVINLKEDSLEKNDDKRGLYHKIPESLQDAQVGQLSIDSMSLQLIDKREKGAVSSSRIGKFSIQIEGLGLDSASLHEDDRVFFAKDIQLNSSALVYEKEGGMYRFGIEELHVSTQEGLWEMGGFRCRPLYPEMEFARRLVYAGDRFNVHIPHLGMAGIDFKEMEKTKVLKVGRINIDDAFLQVFTHKGMPSDPNEGPADFPAIAFQKLELPVAIDTVYIQRSNIHYREHNPKSKKTGEVNFQQLNATIANVTNMKSRLEKDKWLQFRIKTQFMNTTRLNLDLDMDMTDQYAAFNYKGSLAPHSLLFANSFLEPLALLRIEEGNMKALQFQVAGNKFGAESNVTILYDDLKVATLREEDGEIEKRGLLSLFVNWLKVNDSNPEKDGEPAKHSSVRYEHPQESSFFNLLWKSLMAGLQDTAMK